MPDHNLWWNAVVGWETPDPLGAALDALDLILEHLKDHSGVVSTHPVDGVCEARISLQAPTLDAAIKQAIDIVAGATAETPVLVEVQREEIFERRLAHTPASVKPTN